MIYGRAMINYLLIIFISLFSSSFFCHAASATSHDIYNAPAGDAFYNPPKSLHTGEHGNIIWARKIKTDIPNANAWKILYWSTTINNDVIPVSGLLIAPKDKASATGRNIVSWGHGTSGIPRNCAPSLVNNPARDATFYYLSNSDADIDFGIPGLSQMIANGYVVVATDYNGLGAPGIHQYLIGQTEARNLLDAAIAAQQLHEAGAGKKVVVMGWSQGGQASIWAAQIANYVKGKAQVVGAVSLAPVNALEQLKIMNKVVMSGAKLRPVTSAEQVMGWYAMTHAFPELKLSDVMTPLGMEYLAEAVKSQCSHHMADTLAYLQEYKGAAVRKDAINQDAWLKRYEENTLGNVKAEVPIAVYQGDEDLAIYPAATEAYVKKACLSGVTVSFKLYKNTDHIRLSGAAQSDFMQWIADRFAGKAAPSSCE